MITRVFQFALAAALVFPTGAALAFTIEPPTGFVNDRGEMLSLEYGAELEKELADYEKATGHEIAVLTVPDLQGESIEYAAVDVFEQWGIGKEGKDNGLLLMIADAERDVRIEVGYGLEGYITDGRAGLIIRNDIAPNFKDGKFDDGVAAAIASLRGYLEGAPADPSEESGGELPENIIGFIFFVLFVGVRLFVGLLAATPGWWLGGVVGGFFGAGLGAFLGVSMPILGATFAIAGFIFDFFVSRYAADRKSRGLSDLWWWHGPGGSGGFGGGGGFGGFGGGRSGGGGASGGW